MSCRIVVLISGSGSNLQAFIDTLHGRQANIVAVISNRDDAFGLQRAAKAGISTAVLSHRSFADRTSYDQALAALIDSHAPDLVILAGFMRILTAEFAHHYQGRLLNIHPSLLPKYPGLHTHQRALESGDLEHGATVHFVTEELDGGPAILQSHVPVLADDTPESLARLFDNLCTPTHYNAAQAWQRTMMDEKHYWMDDLRYISRWLRTFFGDTIQAHF